MSHTYYIVTALWTYGVNNPFRELALNRCSISNAKAENIFYNHPWKDTKCSEGILFTTYFIKMSLLVVKSK